MGVAPERYDTLRLIEAENVFTTDVDSCLVRVLPFNIAMTSGCVCVRMSACVYILCTYNVCASKCEGMCVCVYILCIMCVPVSARVYLCVVCVCESYVYPPQTEDKRER